MLLGINDALWSLGTVTQYLVPFMKHRAVGTYTVIINGQLDLSILTNRKDWASSSDIDKTGNSRHTLSEHKSQTESRSYGMLTGSKQ